MLILIGILVVCVMFGIVMVVLFIDTRAAAALYAARVMLLLACSLMTMAMPFWQWPACAQ